MKRIRSILAMTLLFCLLVLLAACGKKEEAGEAAVSSPFVGNWTISTFETMGVEFTVDELGELGIGDDELSALQGFSIDIKADETFSLTASGAPLTGNWSGSDTEITLVFDKATHEAATNLPEDLELKAAMEDGQLSTDLSELLGISIHAKFTKGGDTAPEATSADETEATESVSGSSAGATDASSVSVP